MNEIIITLPNGEEEKFDVIFTFRSKNTNKDYVCYTDYRKDKDNNIVCYSGIYDNGNISRVDTEEELNIIDNILKDITNKENINYKIEEK